GQLEIRGHAATDARQCTREGRKAAVLVFVPHRAPCLVVAILLATARIAPGGLDVPARRRTNPYARPRRRNRERANALEFRTVAYRRATRRAVDETFAATQALDAGPGVANMR